ncbi:MAG: hypothetical protein KKD73_00935 [Proteobacteria bacterium]|nr:hypothetical protein [Pseudomonadota bacterium]MBU1641062.1 hypothetical protein [Pseudomonadota bacterium]
MGSDINSNDFLNQNGRLEIEKTWDGNILKEREKTQVFFCVSNKGLQVEVNAPFHNDQAPAAPIGELDGLWEYEVVELFLLGAAGQYLEIEIGPHGHYLILLLAGIRQVKKRLQPSHVEIRIKGTRWQATLILPVDQLPLPLSHANAYAIHGHGSSRRYQAAFPVPGERPDFHQPQFFGSLAKC